MSQHHPPRQLSFLVEGPDCEHWENVTSPDAIPVRLLWRMGKYKRVLAWRRLGRFEGVRELELGGGNLRGDDCPVDVEELFMILPERAAGALEGLCKLFLWRCGLQVDDEFLRALALAGCGKGLTLLALACLCPLLIPPLLVVGLGILFWLFACLCPFSPLLVGALLSRLYLPPQLYHHDARAAGAHFR